jgi:hypothetical protein
MPEYILISSSLRLCLVFIYYIILAQVSVSQRRLLYNSVYRIALYILLTFIKSI